jgi:MoaA/NifB/PqqE/SkfB family radical SAM enzyme
MKKIVELKIGNRCNQNCIHCIIGNKKKELPDMPTNKVLRVIDRYKSYDEVVITSGEPTIRKDFFRIIDYAYKKGVKQVTIHTNARMFSYDKFIQKLNSIGKIKCLVAMVADNKEDFKKITRTDGFPQLEKAVENLVKGGHFVISNTVINNVNCKKLSSIVRKSAELGIKNIQLCAVQAEGNAKEGGKTVVPRISEAAEEVKKAISIGISKNIKVACMGFPFCLLGEYISHSTDIYYRAAEFSELSAKQKNDPSFLKKLNRAKSKKCSCCRYNWICIGLPKEYSELYGTNELKPVKGKEISSMKEIKQELGLTSGVLE